MYSKTSLRIVCGVAVMAMIATCAMADSVQCREQGGKVFLSNAAVKMTLSPDQGGRCISLRMARLGLNRELAMPINERGVGGVFADSLWAPGKDLSDQRYEYSIFGDSKSKSVHFVTRADGDMEHLEVHKTITLTAGASEILVAYEFHNRQESYTDYTFGLTVTNHLRFGGKQTTVVVPGQDGIVRYTPTGTLKEFVDPAGDWMAIANGRQALIARAEYKYVDSMTYDPMSILMRKMVLERGKGVSMRMSLEPITDFSPATVKKLGDSVVDKTKAGVARAF